MNFFKNLFYKIYYFRHRKTARQYNEWWENNWREAVKMLGLDCFLDNPMNKALIKEMDKLSKKHESH